jgi:hypothetical protein
MGICGGVDGDEFSVRNWGFGGIADAAVEGGVCGLGATNRGKGNKEEARSAGPVRMWLNLAKGIRREESTLVH